MKILFEGEQYKNELLEGVLDKRFFSRNSGEIYSTVDCVGYYYNSNSEIKDAILVLPKVFMYNKGKTFGDLTPQEIFEYDKDTKDKLAKEGYNKIIFELSTWIYQAIVAYRKRKPESRIGKQESLNNIVSNLGDSENTELDIVLSLRKFHKENQQLFTYIAKLNHCGQKINWSKTVSKKMPYISGNTPIYPEVIAKKNMLNFDEELLIIFYSTLKYISTKYHFDITLNQNYNLIVGAEFERLIYRGTKKLNAIKYKYFSDKLMALWRLLYAYFARLEETKKSEKKREEVILVKNFNLVFEDMIDDLIGDDKSEIPRYFKDQKDGKRVDHIYYDQSLLGSDKIYFVGDSKYYKTDAGIGVESVEKQFTYAKNVIQYNIKRQNNKTLPSGFKYRDDLTEGYNITPNFFIAAFAKPPFDFSSDGLKADEKVVSQHHFTDRLFDRDSLFVQRYDINFLFVLSAYISRSGFMKEDFKNRARKKFRDGMIEYFNTKYNFYEVTPKDGMSLEDFVSKYFIPLNGKMYQPSNIKNSLIIAFKNTDNISNSILSCDSTYKNYILN